MLISVNEHRTKVSCDSHQRGTQEKQCAIYPDRSRIAACPPKEQGSAPSQHRDHTRGDSQPPVIEECIGQFAWVVCEAGRSPAQRDGKEREERTGADTEMGCDEKVRASGNQEGEFGQSGRQYECDGEMNDKRMKLARKANHPAYSTRLVVVRSVVVSLVESLVMSRVSDFVGIRSFVILCRIAVRFVRNAELGKVSEILPWILEKLLLAPLTAKLDPMGLVVYENCRFRLLLGGNGAKLI